VAEPLTQAQASSAGGIVELKADKSEDLHLAHFYTRQGITLRWAAPYCGADIELACVDLAERGFDLVRIEMHPEDLKIYNSTVWPSTRVYVGGELVKDKE
jgi:hypothetical protein